MGYVDKSDCIMKSYSISRWIWNWIKKLFFHLMDLTTVNSFIILTSCGSKWSHPQLRLTSVTVPWPKTKRQWKQARSTSQLKPVDSRHNIHWLMQYKRIQYHVRSIKNKQTRTTSKYLECNTGLCGTPWFKVHHTKLQFWEPTYTKIDKQNTPM
jgi:hypothetical protein